MTGKELNEYVKATELMVVPGKVAQVSQFSSFLQKLPLKWQKGIAARGAKTNPYMGFIVEPYSFFLSYEVTDIDAAQKLLPEGYRIVPTSMVAESRPRPSVIIGAFNIHTSVFWGSRVEVYLIAENIKTGLLSWIIVTYETNTNSFDPGQGFIGATTSRSVVTTSYRGDVIVDVEGADSGHRIALSAPVGAGTLAALNQRLWIEGNLSVDYGSTLNDGPSEPFGLIFDPREMESALMIPLEKVSVDINTLCGTYTAKEPYEAGCFPFAQHFVTTSMPKGTNMKNAQDLEDAALSFKDGTLSKGR